MCVKTPLAYGYGTALSHASSAWSRALPSGTVSSTTRWQISRLASRRSSLSPSAACSQMSFRSFSQVLGELLAR